MPNAARISGTLRSARAPASGVIVRSSSGSLRAGSSIMLKRNLLRWSQQTQSGDEHDLHQQDPQVGERTPSRNAEPEGRELRRHAELRKCAHGEEIVSPAQESVCQPVLPAIDESVDAPEDGRIP